MEKKDYAIVVAPQVQALGLSPAETLLLSKIAALSKGRDGCRASNEYLALACHCSARTVSRIVARLISKGLVVFEGFDGRRRRLRAARSLFSAQTGKETGAVKESPKSETIGKTADKTYGEEADKANGKANGEANGETPFFAPPARRVCPDGEARVHRQNGAQEKREAIQKEKSPLCPPGGSQERRKRRNKPSGLSSFEVEEFFALALKAGAEKRGEVPGDQRSSSTTESSFTP